MQSLENQIWRSRLAISMKLKLYNMCILPIFLYGSDCWAISKTDACRIDALDQWCLRMLLWHQMVPICTEWWCIEANKATQTHCCNPVVPTYPLWAYYAHGRQCRCQEDPVSLFSGGLEKNHAVPASRGSVVSTVQQDLKQHHLTLPEAADLAQNRALWRMMSTYGATQS